MRLSDAPRTVGLMRAGFGLMTIVSPKLAGLMLGLKGARDLDARGWSLVFATRELALGALALALDDADRATRVKALLLIGAVDASDAVAWIHLSKRYPELKRALPLIVPPAVGSTVAHWAAAATADE